MWLAAGTAADSAAGGTNEIIIAIAGLLGTIFVAAASVIVSLVNSRNSRTAPSPPSPDDHEDWEYAREQLGKHGEELARHDQRLDDGDGRSEVMDRRLDQIERHLDLDKPDWKRNGRRGR